MLALSRSPAADSDRDGLSVLGVGVRREDPNRDARAGTPHRDGPASRSSRSRLRVRGRLSGVSYCAVLIPVLNRPERVEIVTESLSRSLGMFDARPFFIANRNDHGEIAALHDAQVAHLIVPWDRGPGDYARKINQAVKHTDEPWLFLGADDLDFHHGWLDEALAVAEIESVRVVGTRDLGNLAVMQGRHSTHSLVARSYVEEMGTIDMPGMALAEVYDHQYVDNEFVETAQHRGEFAMSEAVVEHLHPHWQKAPDDDTYRLAVKHTRRDQQTFRFRRRRWVGGRQRARR